MTATATSTLFSNRPPFRPKRSATMPVMAPPIIPPTQKIATAMDQIMVTLDWSTSLPVLLCSVTVIHSSISWNRCEAHFTAPNVPEAFRMYNQSTVLHNSKGLWLVKLGRLYIPIQIGTIGRLRWRWKKTLKWGCELSQDHYNSYPTGNISQTVNLTAQCQLVEINLHFQYVFMVSHVCICAGWLTYSDCINIPHATYCVHKIPQKCNLMTAYNSGGQHFWAQGQIMQNQCLWVTL